MFSSRFVLFCPFLQLQRILRRSGLRLPLTPPPAYLLPTTDALHFRTTTDDVVYTSFGLPPRDRVAGRVRAPLHIAAFLLLPPPETRFCGSLSLPFLPHAPHSSALFAHHRFQRTGGIPHIPFAFDTYTGCGLPLPLADGFKQNGCLTCLPSRGLVCRTPAVRAATALDLPRYHTQQRSLYAVLWLDCTGFAGNRVRRWFRYAGLTGRVALLPETPHAYSITLPANILPTVHYTPPLPPALWTITFIPCWTCAFAPLRYRFFPFACLPSSASTGYPRPVCSLNGRQNIRYSTRYLVCGGRSVPAAISTALLRTLALCPRRWRSDPPTFALTDDTNIPLQPSGDNAFTAVRH